MPMKILYLSYLTEAEVFNRIFEAGLEPSVARQKFETAFMSALLDSKNIKKEDITIISCVPYNAKVTQRLETGQFYDQKIKYVWWTQGIASFLKTMRTVQNAVKKWYIETEGEERIILTYATNPVMLLPILSRKCKMITFCSEVPRFRVMGSSLKAKLKKEYYHFMNERMDGYIFFTKYMDEVCNKKGKPSMVVEGMPSIPEKATHFNSTEKRAEQIFYAGGLNAENGILELLEAFVKLGRKDVTLTLCGTGNVVESVQEYAEKYLNIEFKGNVANTKILELERKATLLINPRKAEGALTRYSFPSKTFEYFLSGTPAILTRLDGIPEEYYEYCYECDSSSADSLKKDLEEILEIPQEERMQKAKEAYRFILAEKTAKMQTEKVIHFLSSIL